MPEPPNRIAEDIVGTLRIDWRDLARDIEGELQDEATEGAREMLAALGRSEADDPDLWQRVLDQVLDDARANAAELVGMRVTDTGEIVPNPDAEWSIAENTRDMIHDTVVQALEDGLTANELQRELMESYAFSPERSLNIARTETARARSRGAFLAAKESGVVTHKTWDVASDNVCEECLANAAQGAIPLDDVFESGDDVPPAHPACRCSVTYEARDEEEPEGGEGEPEAEETGEGEAL